MWSWTTCGSPPRARTAARSERSRERIGVAKHRGEGLIVNISSLGYWSAVVTSSMAVRVSVDRHRIR
jgi:hypothetical protein